MPSVSKKQARLMAAVAHNPSFAKKVGIPQSVGKDFNRADTGTEILRKAAGGKINLTGNQLGKNTLGGGIKATHMPSTGMKYSSYRVNPGSMINHTVKTTKIKTPKLADGGNVGSAVQQAAQAADVLSALRRQQAGYPLMPPQTTNASPPLGSYAEGGKVAASAAALRAVSDALDHLAGRDVDRASRTLQGSKDAMAHPDVASAVQDLRKPTGARSAADKLRGVLEADANANKVPGLASGGQVCKHCGGTGKATK